jgi:hypothetical protein
MSAASPLATPAPAPSTDSAPPEIILLGGDPTGQELLEQALPVLGSSVGRMPLRSEPFDLSLQGRRRRDFIDEVIRCVTAKPEVWTTLA